MADLEKFIRAKYEKKMWVKDDLGSDSEYSDYSYSESDTEEGASKPTSKSKSTSKSNPIPSAAIFAPIELPKSPAPSSSPSPRPGLSSLSGKTGRTTGGLNGLSSRSSNSPMEELLMSLTLKSPKSVSPKDEGESVGSTCNTSSISELYGPKSPQIDVSVESILEKRHAMQKSSRVANSSSKSRAK